MIACDHTSVGILVRKGADILLIERKLFPWGYAMPAGHVDGDATFEIAAVRELKEETGLEAGTLELLIEERQENMCRRPAGSWHLWRVYSATVGGELKRSEEETKSAAFYTPAEIKCLAKMTEDYRAGKISEEQWQRQPGLEPIMYDWFKKLELI